MMPSRRVSILVVEAGYIIMSASFSKITSPLLASMRMADVASRWELSKSSGCVGSYSAWASAPGAQHGTRRSATASTTVKPRRIHPLRMAFPPVNRFGTAAWAYAHTTTLYYTTKEGVCTSAAFRRRCSSLFGGGVLPLSKQNFTIS